MTSIKSSEDPAVRFAKLMAELFYFMTEELVDKLGDEQGKAAAQEAIRKFGEARVASMKNEAAERNLSLSDPQTYLKVRDMPSNGWESLPENPAVTTVCPMCDIWDNFGEKGREFGALYCEVDHILFNGFGVKLDRPLCKTKGDSVCDFRLHI